MLQLNKPPPHPLFGFRSGATVKPLMPNTRFILYARKSSEAEDRQVASLESQVLEMQKLAQKRGLNIVGTLVESRSAKSPGRPVFAQVLTQLNQGQVDGIICWKLDRLARNPIDGGSIIWLLQTGLIQHIVTVEGDYNAADGNMLMLYMRFGMAGQYSLDLARDTKRGHENKVRMGWSPTFAPPGYINEKYANKGEKRILPQPVQFDLVKQLFRYFLENEPSIKDLWMYGRSIGITGKTGKPLAHSTLCRLLRNPFYTGKFNFRGEVVTGSHQAMITEQEYQKIQELLAKEIPRIHSCKHQLKYRGMIHCGECGAAITGERHVKVNQKGITREFIYYRCTKRIDPSCSQKAIREKDLQVQMNRILARRGILSKMQGGTVELRLANGKVRVAKLRTIPPVDATGYGLNRTLSFISKMGRVFNER